MNNIFKNFLYWNSGAPSNEIENCPQSEQQKFQKLGLLVLIPAFFAFFSGCYAFSTIINKDDVYTGWEISLILLLALMWSFAIYIIDIYMLTTLKKINSKGNWSYVSQIVTRLFLSIVLGIVISHPLVLKILEDPIKNELLDVKQAQIEKYETKRNTEIKNRVQNEIDGFIDNQKYYDSINLALSSKYIDETQGNGSKTSDGRPNRGIGAISDSIKSIENKFYNSSKNIADVNNSRKKYLQDTLQKQINHKWDSIVKDYSNRPSLDILAKSQALNSIIEQEEKNDNKTTLITYFFILLAFVIFDVSAFLLKVWTSIGPIDYIIEEQTIKYRAEHLAYADFYDENFQKDYANFLTQKIGLESETKRREEILNQTLIHVNFISNERKKFKRSIKSLVEEFRKETNPEEKEKIGQMISSLNVTFLNSVDKANIRFRDMINREHNT